jgi:hypothetical protein
MEWLYFKGERLSTVIWNVFLQHKPTSEKLIRPQRR